MTNELLSTIIVKCKNHHTLIRLFRIFRRPFLDFLPVIILCETAWHLPETRKNITEWIYKRRCYSTHHLFKRELKLLALLHLCISLVLPRFSQICIILCFFRHKFMPQTRETSRNKTKKKRLETKETSRNTRNV